MSVRSACSNAPSPSARTPSCRSISPGWRRLSARRTRSRGERTTPCLCSRARCGRRRPRRGTRSVGSASPRHNYWRADWRKRRLAERTLALATEHDERANQGYALRLLAEIAAQRQPPEWEEAQARYRQALALSSDIGMRPLAAHCHLGLSRVYRRLDRSADAEMHRPTALTMYRATD